MKSVVEFLEKNPVNYFATVGIDGTPKVRPFQFMFEKDGKLFYCTSNQKNVYKEMQKNPRIEISVTGENSAWIRISGKAVFLTDIGLKKMILDKYEFIRSIYGTPDNPVFEVFCLEDGKAVISDFSGTPPQVFSF